MCCPLMNCLFLSSLKKEQYVFKNWSVTSTAIGRLQYQGLLTFLKTHTFDGPKYVSLSVTDVKGKAIPLQASTGPEGSRRLRLPDFMTVGT